MSGQRGRAGESEHAHKPAGRRNLLHTSRPTNTPTHPLQVTDKSALKRARDKQRIRNETQALTQISPSPFLLALRGAFESQTHLFVITPYSAGGDLLYVAPVLPRAPPQSPSRVGEG